VSKNKKKKLLELAESKPQRQYEASRSLTRPYPIIPLLEVRDYLDSEGFIEGLVEVALTEVLEEDSWGFERLLAERLIGFKYQEKLYSLEYTLESCTPQTLLFRLRANTKLLLEALDSATD